MGSSAILPGMRTLALALALLAAGCQDYTTGVQTICNAPRDCQQCQGAEPAKRDQLMAQHMSRSVRNEEARALQEKLSKLDDAERAKLLREAAEKAGLSSCILAERFEGRAKAWAEREKNGPGEPPPE